MSRLRELIDELCPDGVEYKPMSAAAVVMRTPKGVLRSHYGDGSRIPIIDQGQGLVVGYTDDDNLLLDFGDGCTVFGDHTREVKWVSFPFAVGADGVKVLRAAEDIEQKYLFYALSNLNIRSRGYNRHWSVVRDMSIPVPPIEVQREIVRILDSFQELDDALTAEIEAREKQLSWYRAKVYTSTAYPIKELGDIGTFERGRRFTRTEMGGDKAPCIHYGDIYTRCDFFAEEPLDRLVIEKPNLRYAHTGDVVIAATSENAEDVCKAIVWLGDEDAAVHDDCQILHHEQNPYYLSFFFNSEPFMSAKMRFVTESKVVRISGDEMAQIELPLPPVSVQNDIAEALLTFVRHKNAIVAERDARRRQFEYYRDKLLSFPEKEA